MFPGTDLPAARHVPSSGRTLTDRVGSAHVASEQYVTPTTATGARGAVGCRAGSAAPSCSSRRSRCSSRRATTPPRWTTSPSGPGVSKPVLYQHFPGKLDLYLALLDASCDTIIDNCRAALASTHDNKQRVAAAMDAFYDYVAGDTGAFRLVFESDLTNEPAVREHVDRVTTECAGDDRRRHPRRHRPARRRRPGCSPSRWWEWPRSARGSGCPRQPGIEPATQADAAALVSGLAWRGIRGYPLTDDALTHHRSARRRTTVEVKIGVQHAARELVVDTDESADDVEKQVADAVADDGVLALDRHQGPQGHRPGRQARLRRDRRRRRRPGRLPELTLTQPWLSASSP